MRYCPGGEYLLSKYKQLPNGCKCIRKDPSRMMIFLGPRSRKCETGNLQKGLQYISMSYMNSQSQGSLSRQKDALEVINTAEYQTAPGAHHLEIIQSPRTLIQPTIQVREVARIQRERESGNAPTKKKSSSALRLTTAAGRFFARGGGRGGGGLGQRLCMWDAWCFPYQIHICGLSWRLSCSKETGISWLSEE